MRRALAIPWRRFGAALPLRLRSLRSGRPLGRWMAAGVAVAVVYRSKMHDYRCSENSQVATQRRPPPFKGGCCVITGPSGVGKSTLIKKLLAEFPHDFGFSVSHTTRDPRPGEQDGVDYHFVTGEQMKRDINAGLFVEHAEVHGNLYGTSIAAVQDVMKKGRVCLLDIDVQGAESVRKSSLSKICSFVFFAPPTAAVLEQRLRGRGTETEEKIQKRLAASLRELSIYEGNPDAWDLTLKFYNEQGEIAYKEFRAFLQSQIK